MLTLGLMEGIFAAAAMALALFAVLEYNLPIHRLLAPPALAGLGYAGYTAFTSDGAVNGAWQAIGLAAFAGLAFLGPIGALAWMRKQIAALEETPAKTAAPAQTPILVQPIRPRPPRVVVRPLQRTRARQKV